MICAQDWKFVKNLTSGAVAQIVWEKFVSIDGDFSALDERGNEASVVAVTFRPSNPRILNIKEYVMIHHHVRAQNASVLFIKVNARDVLLTVLLELKVMGGWYRN